MFHLYLINLNKPSIGSNYNIEYYNVPILIINQTYYFINIRKYKNFIKAYYTYICNFFRLYVGVFK